MTTFSHYARAPQTLRTRSRLSFACLAVAAMIAGCSGGEKSGSEQATQVAAKVDGTEISVHQINYLLARSKLTADSPEAAKALRKQVLDKLVDQQLLVAKAVEDKLDRSPDVQMGIEASRKDVLADAYLQQASGGSTKPDEAQVKAYYSAHPELFEHRRIYKLLEITFPATAPQALQSAIKSAVDTGKPSDDVLKMLSTGGVEVAKADTQRAAEQISLDLLPRLYRLNPGQGLVTTTPQNVTIIYVKSSEESPIAQSAALPRIGQFLTNQSLSQNVGTLMKNLRSKAKVEYVGEFAPTDAASPK